MDKAQTLQLFLKGKVEWNKWAQESLTARVDTDIWKTTARCDFSEHAFKGDVDFSGFVFPGDARFRAARFKETVRFEGAQFHGQANFYEAVFGHIADFRTVEFNSDFLIAGATLERGPLTLGGAKFLGKADFRSVQGNAALFLEEATFACCCLNCHAGTEPHNCFHSSLDEGRNLAMGDKTHAASPSIVF